MIPVDSATLTALAAPGVRIVQFLELELDGPVYVRYCTAGFDIEWTSPTTVTPETWSGVGGLMDLDPMQEGSGMEALSWQIALSAVSSEILALATLENVFGRRASAWIGAYDEAGALVSTPFLKFEGLMSDMTIEDNPQSARVILTVESFLIALRRARAEYWTNAEQKRRYPTDDGLRFTDLVRFRTLSFGPRQ